jgi:cytochrome c
MSMVFARLYGLPEPRQNGYLSAAAGTSVASLSRALLGSRKSMNSFELNKILGAILGTCLILLALNIGAGAIFAPEKPAKPGYEIAVKEHGAGDAAGAAKEAEEPMEAMMASASVEKGQATAKQCAACHTLEKGGPNRVGPNLYGIVGRARASEAGFNYSAAMKAKGGTWSFGELYAFLANPRGFIPGTNMTFAGLSRGQQRADVIDFLHTLSDSPMPLPKAAANAPAPAAPKAGAAAPPAKH